MLPSCQQLAILALCLTALPSAAVAQRPAWTTSRVQGSPTPPLPFTAERVFGEMSFHHPVTFTRAPGTNSMFLLEQHGKIYELASENVSKPHLVADLAQLVRDFEVAYGLAFHPDFQQNREIYVCYLRQGDAENGTRLSRFRLTRDQPIQLEADSEQQILTWLKGGHNGGCVQFGPDGYLYISAGDAAAPFPPDPDRVGQDVGNLLSTIMRINVDDTGDRSYTIPADNPFVGLEDARPEVYAYGFRNPWRMAFDRETGDLWVGDVGWELWEMVYDVRSGGNYGWRIMEGPKSLHPNDPRGPTPIQPPAASHSHTEARSITGGQVYYGDRLPELKGYYLYGDHVTGRIWKLRKRDGNIEGPIQVARAPLQIICFGLHHNGEVYIVDYAGGIYRLQRSKVNEANQQFPTTLSQTGLFADTGQHQVSTGVLPYAINAEPWMDGGTATRFLAIPGEERIGVYREGGGHANWDGKHRGSWKFPQDTVLGKTISLDGRRVETQLLHYDGQAWQAYSYAWNETQSDATLASDQTQTIEVPVHGEIRHWQITNRSDCMICHSNANDMLLGFKPEQLQRPFGDIPNQLAYWQDLGLFEVAPPDRPPIHDPHDASFTLEERAKAYLHVNCAHCHRRDGGGSVPMDVVYTQPLDRTRIIDEVPTQGTFGIQDARVISPGKPQQSVLLYRFCKSGPGHMPKLGGLEVDHEGASLLYEWIASLGNDESPTARVTLSDLFDANADDTEIITTLSPIETSMHAIHALRSKPPSAPGRDRLLRLSKQLPPASQELYEPFAPFAQRTVRLGRDVNVDVVLAEPGDPERGRELFLSTRLTCRTCHATEPGPPMVGPNLATLNRERYQPRTLLTSILEPSREIDPQYRTQLIVMTDGRVRQGIVEERQDRILLRDAQNQVHTIHRDDIEFQKASDVSLMPDSLLAELTLTQAADLIAYLSQLNASSSASPRQ